MKMQVDVLAWAATAAAASMTPEQHRILQIQIKERQQDWWEVFHANPIVPAEAKSESETKARARVMAAEKEQKMEILPAASPVPPATDATEEQVPAEKTESKTTSAPKVKVAAAAVDTDNNIKNNNNNNELAIEGQSLSHSVTQQRKQILMSPIQFHDFMILRFACAFFG